ncbi:MAG: tetratricopeptide repeat protein [Chitinophagales bacterium]
MQKLNIEPPLLYEKRVRIQDAFNRLDLQLGSSNRPLVLKGIGGSGKTNLCQDYYQNMAHKYTHRIWISFQVDIFISFLAHTELLETLGLNSFEEKQTQEQQIEKIVAALKAFAGRKLLIIDAFDKDITQAERKFLVQLQRQINTTILISSRNVLQGFKTLDMQKIDAKEAQKIYVAYRDDVTIDYYDGYIKQTDYVPIQTTNTENALIAHVKHHPLLLELTAKTVRNYISITAKSLLQKFKTYDHAMPYGEVYLDRTEEEYKIDIHLRIIFEAVKLPEAQRNILREISLLPSLMIPYEKLKTYIHKPKRSDTFLQTHIQQLLDYGWLQREGRSLQMHRTIQFTVDAQIPYEKSKHFHVGYNINQISLNRININYLEAQPYTIYIEHIIPFLLKNKEIENAATSYNNLALIYKVLGNLAQALTYQEKATAIQLQILNKKHPDLAQSYNNLASIYLSLGNLTQALEYQKKALAIQEQIFNNNHPDLATSYNNLSTIYLSLDNLEQALTYQKKALIIREQILNNNEPALATSYNNLALIYKELGKASQALNYQEKAIIIQEAILDKKHPDLAISYNNLALICQKIGKLSEALKYQKKVIVIQKQIFDERHPSLAISYHNLSAILIAKKEFKQALFYNEKAIAILQYNFPNGHRYLDATLSYQFHLKKQLGLL